jgi:hypothetical protein
MIAACEMTSADTKQPCTTFRVPHPSHLAQQEVLQVSIMS